MTEPTYTQSEAQLHFARQINGRVWELLDKAERSAEEDEEMLAAAYASLYHWLVAGTAVNRQRGHWLIARVHSRLGYGEEALRHARRCLELTTQQPELMADFDVAFACEGMARAYAVLENETEARAYLLKAEEAGRLISDPEDRTIFFDSFYGGDWHGVR
jgi:tetratricopeptide (TPR) repeat protein